MYQFVEEGGWVGSWKKICQSITPFFFAQKGLGLGFLSRKGGVRRDNTRWIAAGSSS
jgi:hypothetical protein